MTRHLTLIKFPAAEQPSSHMGEAAPAPLRRRERLSSGSEGAALGGVFSQTANRLSLVGNAPRSSRAGGRVLRPSVCAWYRPDDGGDAA